MVEVTTSRPRPISRERKRRNSNPPAVLTEALEASKTHLDARTWMPTPRSPNEATRSVSASKGETSALAEIRSDLVAHRESHQRLLANLSASLEEHKGNFSNHQALVRDALKELQPQPRHSEHLSIENLRADDGLRHFVEELAEPLRASLDEVATACAQQHARHEELIVQVSDLRVVHCQTEIATSQQQEPWRRELEALRLEQQAALADQVRLLKHQFEAAYRAEQLADAAVGRVGVLERNLAEAQEERQFQILEKRLIHLELGQGGTATASTHEAQSNRETLERRIICAESEQAERISQLHRQMADLAGAVSCQAEKLCQFERELLSSTAMQSGQLAEASSQRQHLSRNLHDERAAWQASIAELRSELQLSLGQRSLPARTEHDEQYKKLGRLYDNLAGQVANVHQHTSDWSSDMVRRLGAEAEARVSADVQLRDELTNAMVVVKSQFEEWMEVVTAVKSEVAASSQGSMLQQDPQMEKRSELPSIVEFACNTFTQECQEVELGRRPDGQPPLDLTQMLTSNSSSELSVVCRLISDTFGFASGLWKRCASDAAKCREETRVLADQAESLQRQLSDACREWTQQATSLNQQLARLPAAELPGGESEFAKVKRDLGMVLTTLGAREDGRAVEVGDLHARLQCVERRLDLATVSRTRETLPARSPERAGQKLQARRTILHAVESMEAAAQRVALEASAHSRPDG